MSRMSAPPKNGFGALRLGVGFPFLLLALLLAQVNTPARIFFVTSVDLAARSLEARERAPEASAMRPTSQSAPRVPAKRATIEPAGWRAHVYGAPLGFTNVGLIAAVDLLADATRAAPGIWPVSAASASSIPHPYRSQAPPS